MKIFLLCALIPTIFSSQANEKDPSSPVDVGVGVGVKVNIDRQHLRYLSPDVIKGIALDGYYELVRQLTGLERKAQATTNTVFKLTRDGQGNRVRLAEDASQPELEE